MKDEQKTLLPNLRPAQQATSFCKRIARIRNYVIFLFIVLYVVSYLRVVDVPKAFKQTPSPSSPFVILPSKFATDPENVTEQPNPEISTTLQPNPEISTTLQPNPGISTTLQPNPEISTTLQPKAKKESKIACKIPKLDPFHKTVKPFLQEVQVPPKCQEKYPRVFKLGLNFTVVRESNTTEWKECCYKIISRSNTTSNNVDKEIIYSQDCVPMSEEVTQIPIETEFIGIFCTSPQRQKEDLNNTSSSKEGVSDTKQLIDAFAFIPPKEKQNQTAVSDTGNVSNDKLNVLIYGIDGVSRMNFLRTLPQIHKFLIQNLSAISMESYVKVGDNTYPNLIAVLTAMNASSVDESCGKTKFFDDCPFLWKKFAAEGYKTSFGEDASWMGTFNYLKKGFNQPPVDYYLRPIAHVLDQQLGSDKRGAPNICNGPRLAVEVLLNYIQKTALALNERNQRYFQFIWASSLTHDYLNLGRLGENVTLETLQWFHAEGHLNKTLLVLMSDHGIRFGGFRKTKQGQIEESLPFLYFVLPDWFKQKYPSAIENMKKNTKRLTTPFDLHETLLDILNTTNLEESEINQRNEELDSQRQKNEVPRGISMFLPSPPERTCEMAGIPEHFCACHKTEDLEPKSSLAQQAANFAVYELNSFTSEFIECAFLTLQNVTSADMFDLTQTTNEGEQVVKISFVTSPGGAEFEGTVVRHLQNNKTDSWSLSDVSRVNLYGDDSHCVSDKEMKKYCFCADLLRR